MSDLIRYDTKMLEGFVSDEEIQGILPELVKAHNLLAERSGPGNDFLGWLDLPAGTDMSLIEDIEETAEKLKENSDVVIVIGIGGSYLGAKSAIEMLSDEFEGKNVIFAGHNISDEYMGSLLRFIENKDVSVNVISKSGTTTEPAIAFRLILDKLKKKYSAEELKERIVCTTDKERGALKTFADSNGYKCFVIPDDVGGRFSVLTPVGLLPCSVSGLNIRDIIDGAKICAESMIEPDPEKNIAIKYAAVRNVLYRKGKVVEVLSNFDGQLHYISEWWKQLFGESEGKDSKGIFPASCNFTTDLHSMGQYIQDGMRNIFETFLISEEDNGFCRIPEDEKNLDNLNYLAGKGLSFVNHQAYLATSEAHFEGGVPNSSIILPEKTEHYLGQLLYFFETAVALSGYVLDVNPFNQPGVEAYKKKMFKLLGKPGV